MTERPKSVTEDVDDLDINCYSWQSRQFKLCTCKRQQKIYYNKLYDFNELYNYYTLFESYNYRIITNTTTTAYRLSATRYLLFAK